MIGLHHVIIESARLKYEFTLRRNITLIQGDSATGKTTLIELNITGGSGSVDKNANTSIACCQSAGKLCGYVRSFQTVRGVLYGIFVKMVKRQNSSAGR